MDHRVWRTEDGRLLRIQEMSDRHLDRCIRMLEYKQVREVEQELVQDGYLVLLTPEGDVCHLLLGDKWRRWLRPSLRAAFEAGVMQIARYKFMCQEQDRRTDKGCEALFRALE